MPKETLPLPVGRVRVHQVVRPSKYALLLPQVPLYPGDRVVPPGWKPLTGFNRNLVLKQWGAIVGNGLRLGTPEYRISTMYLEYVNQAIIGPVTPPSFSREHDSAIAYYNGLAGSPDHDYLRVPVIASQMLSSDPVAYPEGNEPVFFAQSQGTVGVHGKPFSDAVNSRLIGGALVASIDPADATRDLILSRFYLNIIDQQEKLPTSQLGLEWDLVLQ